MNKAVFLPNYVWPILLLQPMPMKCKMTGLGQLTSGHNSLSYMSFITALVALVININNRQVPFTAVNSLQPNFRSITYTVVIFSINNNNNNNNNLALNYGSSSNSITNLNQNVGNDFNLMFPPG